MLQAHLAQSLRLTRQLVPQAIPSLDSSDSCVVIWVKDRTEFCIFGTLSKIPLVLFSDNSLLFLFRKHSYWEASDSTLASHQSLLSLSSASHNLVVISDEIVRKLLFSTQFRECCKSHDPAF